MQSMELSIVDRRHAEMEFGLRKLPPFTTRSIPLERIKMERADNRDNGLSTGIHCPLCGEEVILPDESWSRELMQAIELRSDAQGTHIECRYCLHSFTYRKLKYSASYRRPA